MANSLVALGVQNPQINTLAAYDQSQANELQNKSTRMAQARQGLEWVGSMALGAMGGKLDGEPDPQRWEEGLGMLAQSGVDKGVIEALRGRPDLAPTIARASLDTMQQISVANSDRDFDLALQRFDLQVQEAAEARQHRAWQRDQAMKPDPGFTLLTPDEVQAAQLPPGSYQRGPDNKIYEIGGGGQTINVGSEVGTIPQGYELFTDKETGARSLRPIAGGPAAADMAAADAKANLKSGQQDTVTGTITNEAAKARKLIGPFTTGPGQFVLGNVPFSEAAELKRHVNALTSIAAAENLNAMRQASPTGGALGNASDADIQLLKDKAGALDPNSPNFPEQLDDYERTVLRIVHGPEAGDEIFKSTRDAAAPSGGPQPGAKGQGDAPEGVDPDLWGVMTPEEKALWQN